jgi:poly-gamma-glutamate capsule biosynthesis protein CapA/YwtB (metallophosphatase superfamily)
VRLPRLLLGLWLLGMCCRVNAEPGVTLAFAGDLMLDDGPGRAIAAGRDPLQAFDSLLRGVDYAIGNLECPVGTIGTPVPGKFEVFQATPTALAVLKGRFQGLSVANNHAGDYGRVAFLHTMALAEQAGFALVGGGPDLRRAHAPLWIERNGLRIAVLAYNEFKPRSFEAGPDWPGVAWSEDAAVVADIQAARAAGADLVIPFMHWGWEYEPQPSARQRTLARVMIDAGADVVVGGHPHVTQGAEYYRGKLIVYSLGNFVFDSFKTDATRTGWLLRLALNRHGLTRWDTHIAFMDEDGLPQRRPGAASPCGKAGDTQVEKCINQ